jgi:hypothetical protein
MSAVRWASTSELQNVQQTSIRTKLKESDRGAYAPNKPLMTRSFRQNARIMASGNTRRELERVAT